MALEVASFELEDLYGEEYTDFMKVYDGETTNDPVLGTYKGSLSPFTLPLPTGRHVLITFTTDLSIQFKGFRIEFSYSGVYSV